MQHSHSSPGHLVSSQIVKWAHLAASFGLAWLLYFRVIGIPLYHDDLVLVRLVSGTSLRDILFGPQIYQYYRPIYDAIWKLAFLIAGFDRLSLLLHIIFVCLHAINGWLVGIVAGYLYPGRRAVQWLAMAIYVAFPFTYQAVPWASATGHLIVACGVLASVIGLERWWIMRRWPDMALIAAGTFVATFTHEAGVVSGLIVGGWLVFKILDTSLQRIRQEWRSIVRVLLPVALINGAYVTAWITIPKDKEAFGIFIGDVFNNLLFFGQGLTYPIAQLGGLLMEVGIEPFPAAVIVVISGLAALIGVHQPERGRGAWIGIGWFAAGVLPSAIFLPWWTYVIDGHRLAVTASIGAALAWAGGVDILWRWHGWAGRILAGLLAGLLVVGGLWYVLRQMGLHGQFAPLYRDLYATSRDHDQIAIFNLPGWISYRERIYPLGNDGINYTTEYFPLSLLIWANTGHEPETGVFVWHDVVEEQPAYWFGLLEGGNPDPVYRLDMLRRVPVTLSAEVVNGRWMWEQGGPVGEGAFAQSTIFTNGVRLAVQASYISRQQVVSLTLTWETPEPIEEVAFVHLLCGEQIVAQADGPPLNGIFPFADWLPGQRWGETRLLGVPKAVEPTCLRVRVGLYHPATGERIALEDGGDYILVPVDVE